MLDLARLHIVTYLVENTRFSSYLLHTTNTATPGLPCLRATASGNFIYSQSPLASCLCQPACWEGDLSVRNEMDSFQAFELASKNAAVVAKRQQPILAIPTTYLGLNSGPKPGVLVGIVLGSVAGFLLILWLIWAIATLGAGVFGRRRTTIIEEEVVRKSSNSRRRERVYYGGAGSRHRTELRTRETGRGGVEGEVCDREQIMLGSADDCPGRLRSKLTCASFAEILRTANSACCASRYRIRARVSQPRHRLW